MDLDKERMNFIHIYIKTYGFGQKSVLMGLIFLRFF